MKIRQKHITNSSSSSFIIRNSLLTEDQREVLCSDIESPEGDLYATWIPFSYNKKKNTWTTECSCNQDEIVENLERHHIPYTAEIHYGHYIYIYDGKYRLEATNWGEILNTYGVGHALMWKRVLKKVEKEDTLVNEIMVYTPENGDDKGTKLANLSNKGIEELEKRDEEHSEKESCWQQINDRDFEKENNEENGNT